MTNQIIALKRFQVGFLKLCFWIFLIFFACEQAQCDDANIIVSLSCFKEQVGISEPNQGLPKLISINEANSLDPVILKFIIINKSTKDISILWPEFPAQTLIPIFWNKSDNKLISPQVKWSASFIQDYINIAPGNTYEVLLFSEEIFPFGIQPGTYEIRLKYTPDYKTWVETNAVLLKIAPMSEEEKKEHKEVEAILVGGFSYKPEGVKLFLTKYPDSRYKNLLRFESIDSLMMLEKFDSANSMLNTIIADKKATTFKKNQAYRRKGYLLKKTGNLEEAIKCMEKAKFIRSAYRDAMKWKKEEKIQKQ